MAVYWMSVSYWPLTGLCWRSRNAIPNWAPESTEHTVHNSGINHHSQNRHKSSISDRNRYSRLTMTKPDPHNQRRAKSCRLLYVPDRQHDFAIYRQICSHRKSYKSGQQMSQEVIFRVVMLFAFPSTFLRPWGPPSPPPLAPLDCPNGIHSHLSREKPSPFRKCFGGCTVGWRARWRAERGEAWRHN
jgi:hypothetical protein